jgi:ribose-phosphate pyrophosphokinase
MRKPVGDEIRIFSGRAHFGLAENVAKYLGTKVGDMKCSNFSDGENRITINESARGDDVYIIQPTCAPTNDNLMELLIIIDAFRRASVNKINVIMPYYGYARQDKKTKSREPITAAMVAGLLEKVGASRIVCIDIHSPQIQGFFDIPFDHLYAGPLIVDYYRNNPIASLENTVAVSPDVSGVPRARNLAEALGIPIAMVAKRRPEPNVVEILEVVGDIVGKHCIMIDDMFDTAGTIIAGAEALLKRGAESVEVAATHPVFSKNAANRLQDSPVARVVCLDTIPLPPIKIFEKLVVLPSAPLIGQAIQRLHDNESVSELFLEWNTH